VPLLECRQLVRRPWIEGFDLVLEAGEIVLLTGPSGSGKTLLMRTIADLDPADGGEVLLGGRQCSAFRPCEWRSRVLYLHQAAVRLPGTVQENLERIGSLGLHAGARLELPQLGMAGLAQDAPIEQLSGGEIQRLALYRAMALEPTVLLLDEATSALDAAAARDAEQAVTDWAARGRAVLWVSHDLSAASRLGAREVSIR